MLSYQHIYHAGNLADIQKHALLCYMLSYLAQKEKPFCYIETHGGRALYDLQSAEALKTGEAQEGIEKVLERGAFSVGEAMPYQKALSSLQDRYGKETYPGSPLFAAHFLRSQDTAHIAELHPQEVMHLRKTFQKHRHKTHIHHQDGLKMADGLIPPMPRRGLLMIDPSYEMKEEYQEIVSFIAKMHKKWPVGVIALWYPILSTGLHQPMVQALRKNHPEGLCHEVSFAAIRDHRLQGSGMFVINPPYQTEDHCLEIERIFTALR